MSTAEKIDEKLTPNLRALRLTMTISEILLSMGVSANSVVSKALDVTDSYCSNPVHMDINANVIMLSQLRGVANEPLTLIRPVSPREVNYMTMQAVQNLIHDIREGVYLLDDAESELDRIISRPKRYPNWLIMLGQAGIAVGVSSMFTSSIRAMAIVFAVGLGVDRLLKVMIKRMVPSFFRQAGAALFVTLSAAAIAALGRNGLTIFSDTNPTLIVVGGIVMLLAGLLIVGAIQDAIEEYYITAAARILKVAMLTVGIAVGTLIGLYTARKLGYGIIVSSEPLELNILHMQLVGAAIATGAYALSTHTPLRAIGVSAFVGSSALLISYFAKELDISSIAASGVAAVGVGFMASIIARIWKTPSAGIIAAGIIPLVPGLALYNGLMQLINYPPGDPNFFKGLGTFSTALSIALSIAAGATFGSMISKPLRQKLASQRNMTPFMELMKKQLRVGRNTSVVSSILKYFFRIKKNQ